MGFQFLQTPIWIALSATTLSDLAIGVATARTLKPRMEERMNFIVLGLVQRMFLQMKNLKFVQLEMLLEMFGSGWVYASPTY